MNWLDSWDDWINPITLRELRCNTRGYGFEVFVLFFWFVAIIGYAAIFYIPDLRQNLLQKEQALLFSVFPAALSLCNFLQGFGVSSSIRRGRIVDELLDNVPLSPQQLVHGYWAFICIYSVFWISLSLPLIAVGQLVGPVPYILLLVPLGSFFLSQIMTLIYISFVARIKQDWEAMLSFFTALYFYPGLVVFIWYYVIIFALHLGQQLVWNNGFGFVSLFILLPVMLLLHGYIAYRLSLYGFRTWRKPFWRSLLLNITVYTLFHVTAAAIWIAMVAVVFICNTLLRF
jgi:hypothetical protein